MCFTDAKDKPCPPLTIIEAFGLSPCDLVRRALRLLGFERIEVTARGFTASRDQA